MNLLTLERFKPSELSFLLHLGQFFLIFLVSLPDESHLIQIGDKEPTIAVVLSILVAIGTALLIEQKPIGRWLLQLLLILGMAITMNHYLDRPSVCLLVSVAFISLMRLVTNVGLIRIRSRSRHDTIEYAYEMTFYSILFNLAVALAVYFLFAASGTIVHAAVLYGNILTWTLLILALRRSFLSLGTSMMLELGLIAALIASLVYFSGSYLPLLSRTSILISLCCLFLAPIRRQLKRRITAFGDIVFIHPEGAVIIFFFILCLIGTFILYSPLSAVNQSSLALVDVAFTAVSAACINGLAVLDTALDFSFFGQFMILLLIQLGGLGIMAMSSMLFLVLGHRLTVSQEETVFETAGQMLKGEVYKALRQVLLVTFSIELLGACLLSLFFLSSADSLPAALWQGIFTAISAFCNAGIALQSQGFISYQSHPAIIHTVGLLVIAGSLSPAFIIAIPHMLKGQKIPLQFKIVALANIILLLSGHFAFLILEWNQSLQGLGLIDKLNNSWFQSLTARSAGFNTVDLSLLHPATIFIIMTLMFIGGSPGGTGGGIRTTTFMILIFTVFSIARGEQDVRAFDRVISRNSVYRATTVVSCGLLIGLFGLLSLLTTQRIDPILVLFDVVSASGNVGLSLGAVAELDQIGKIIVMIIMFLGRVGTLSVILYLGHQVQAANWKYPEEEVSVA